MKSVGKKRKKKQRRSTPKKKGKKKKSPARRQQIRKTRKASADANRRKTKIEKKVAVFVIGQEKYAFELDIVMETLYDYDIVSMPHLPNIFAGVIKSRAASIPVVDLRNLLKWEGDAMSNRTCLVVKVGSKKIGFLVDSDIEIIATKKGTFHTLPDCFTEDETKFINSIFRIGDDFVGILKPAEMMQILTGWREIDEKI